MEKINGKLTHPSIYRTFQNDDDDDDDDSGDGGGG